MITQDLAAQIRRDEQLATALNRVAKSVAGLSFYGAPEGVSERRFEGALEFRVLEDISELLCDYASAIDDVAAEVCDELEL